MINTLERWAISVKRRREERAEQKRQWEEQDRKRKDIERQIRVEGYRITFLQRQVERKREIDGLAGLIDLWSRAEDPDPKFSELLEFARLYRKWLDAKLSPAAISERLSVLQLLSHSLFFFLPTPLFFPSHFLLSSFFSLFFLSFFFFFFSFS